MSQQLAWQQNKLFYKRKIQSECQKILYYGDETLDMTLHLSAKFRVMKFLFYFILLDR